MKCLEVPKDRGLVVYGPAKLAVEKGEILASGLTLRDGSEAIIRSTRGISLLSLSSSRVCISVGRGGHYQEVGEELKKLMNWLSVLDRIKEEGYKRIMVVGEPDTGKSSFSLWAYNFLGYCLLEADVGQNELGYPAMVSIVKPKGEPILVLQDANADASWFVGHVRIDIIVELHVLAAINAARNCPGNIIVDTDGFVEGKGLYHKSLLAETLNIDAIAIMESPKAKTLESFFSKVGYHVISVPSPPKVLKRSLSSRKEYREYMYARLFTTTYQAKIALDKVANLCSIQELGGERIYNCGHLLITEGKTRTKEVRSISSQWARGLIAGIRLRSLRSDIPGIVDNLSLERGIIVLRTPKKIDESDVHYVMLGFIRLDQYMHEAEKTFPGFYPEILLRKREGRSP
ncbi:MAG: Clp1/GlmU family protein [Pyrodictiaceae archaeon]